MIRETGDLILDTVMKERYMNESFYCIHSNIDVHTLVFDHFHNLCLFNDIADGQGF